MEEASIEIERVELFRASDKPSKWVSDVRIGLFYRKGKILAIIIPIFGDMFKERSIFVRYKITLPVINHI